MQTDRRSGSGAGAGQNPDVEDIVAVLRRRFGDRHQQSYEHGKHDFREALAEHYGMDKDDASHLVEDLEQAQVLRFKSAGDASTRDTSGPRIGLFDEPGPVVDDTGTQATPDYGGRYWAIGREDDVPGVP
ncbi:MAG: hypothetical protein ACRDJN_00200 [Chloroflexota bacterium]